MEIELGATYRDLVTGVEGIATAKTEHLFRPTMVFLESETHRQWCEIDRIVRPGAPK